MLLSDLPGSSIDVHDIERDDDDNPIAISAALFAADSRCLLQSKPFDIAGGEDQYDEALALAVVEVEEALIALLIKRGMDPDDAEWALEEHVNCQDMPVR